MRGTRLLAFTGLAAYSLVWSEIRPTLETTLLQDHQNSYAVRIVIRNSGDEALESVRIGWNFVWTDHSAPTVSELDYASQSGTTITTEERNDYTGTAWISLPYSLPVGDSAVCDLRLHTQDWQAIQSANDPSFQLGPQGTTLYIGELPFYGSVPTMAFPPEAKQSAQVTTTVIQHSDNTLGLTYVIRNTGEIPLRNVQVSYFANVLPNQSPLVGNVDYSALAGASVQALDWGNGSVEMLLYTGSDFIPAGASREIHVRLHTTDWSATDFADDYSFPSGTGPNERMILRADGLLLSGILPGKRDSDGDGLEDSLEVEIGSDPFDASDAPWVGIPDQLRVPVSDITQYIVYDFGRIPGYTTRRKVAVAVAPGTLAEGKVPSIRYSGDSLERPPLLQRNFVRSGGFFQIHADIREGATIAMAIPLPDFEIGKDEADRLGAFRFDTTLQAWQPLNVTHYDGAVHVTTKRFSDVQAGWFYNPQSIAAGGNHVLAIDSLGANQFHVVAFGTSANGEIGAISPLTASVDSVIQVLGLPDNIREVAAGDNHSFALDMSGRLWAWGDNRYGQLGISSAIAASATPLQVVFPEGVGIRRIVSANHHAFAEDVVGRWWTWGHNEAGQLGIGTLENQYSPILLNVKEKGSAVRLRSVAGGKNHSLALDSAGRLWSWGKNDAGQLLIAQDSCNRYKACHYTTDTVIHTPEVHGFDGYEGKGVWGGIPTWKDLAAGDNSGMAIKIDYAQPFAVVWGGDLQAGTARPYGHSQDMGAQHFAVLRFGGFTLDSLLPDGSPEDLVSLDKAQSLYGYRYTLMYGGGRNQEGQLGCAGPQERSCWSHIEGAQQIAAAQNYTVLWQPADSVLTKTNKKIYRPFALKIVGNLAGHDYGYSPVTLAAQKGRNLDVQIVYPVEGQKVVRGTQIPVQWLVGGLPQQSKVTETIAATAKLGDTLKIIRSASDIFGNKSADTVRVVVDTLSVRNVSVTGGLHYPINQLDSTKRLNIALELTDSSQVTVLARNGKGVVACQATLGKWPAGAHVLSWDGLCDSGKWIAEGVYHLDLQLQIGSTVLANRAPAWATAATATYVGWVERADILAQVLDSIVPAASQWVAVDALAGTNMSPTAQYQVFATDSTKKGTSLDCGNMARRLGDKRYYRVTRYKWDSRTFVATVTPATQFVGLVGQSAMQSAGQVISFTAPAALQGSWYSRVLRGNTALGWDHAAEVSTGERQEWWSNPATTENPWLVDRAGGVRLEYWWSNDSASSQVFCVGGGE